METTTASSAELKQGSRSQRKRPNHVHPKRFPQRTTSINPIRLRQPQPNQISPPLSPPLLRLTSNMLRIHRQHQKILNMARIQPRPHNQRHQTSRQHPRPRKNPKPHRLPQRLPSRTPRRRNETWTNKQLHKKRQNLLPRQRNKNRTVRTPKQKSSLQRPSTKTRRTRKAT